MEKNKIQERLEDNLTLGVGGLGPFLLGFTGLLKSENNILLGVGTNCREVTSGGRVVADDLTRLFGVLWREGIDSQNTEERMKKKLMVSALLPGCLGWTRSLLLSILEVPLEDEQERARRNEELEISYW